MHRARYRCQGRRACGGRPLSQTLKSKPVPHPAPALETQYAELSTAALLDLHAAGTLTDDAYAALESELRTRGVTIPDRPAPPAGDGQPKATAIWARRFAVVGVVLPAICLALEFEPALVMRACELCWPTGFLLLAADGDMNVALVLLAIGLNALPWAGLGWVVGYARSRVGSG